MYSCFSFGGVSVVYSRNGVCSSGDNSAAVAEGQEWFVESYYNASLGDAGPAHSGGLFGRVDHTGRDQLWGRGHHLLRLLPLVAPVDRSDVDHVRLQIVPEDLRATIKDLYLSSPSF